MGVRVPNDPGVRDKEVAGRGEAVFHRSIPGRFGLLVLARPFQGACRCIHEPNENHASRPSVGAIVVASLFAIALVLWGSSDACAQEPILESHAKADQNAAIRLNADEITTWKDGDQNLFLLKGKVTASQGDLSLRMPQGAVWLTKNRASAGAYLFEIYGEGEIELEQRGAVRKAAWGLVQLSTSGDVDVQSRRGKIPQINLSIDPVFQRGFYHRVRNSDRLKDMLAEGVAQTAPGKLPITVQSMPARLDTLKTEPLPLPSVQSKPLVPLVAPSAPAPSIQTVSPNFETIKTWPALPEVPSAAMPPVIPSLPTVPEAPNRVASTPLVPAVAVSRDARKPEPTPELIPVQNLVPVQNVVPVPPANSPLVPPPMSSPLVAPVPPEGAVPPPPAPPGAIPPPPQVKPEPSIRNLLADPAATYEVSIKPRSSVDGRLKQFPAQNAVVYTGGVTVLVIKNGKKRELLDLEADHLVAFYKEKSRNPSGFPGSSKTEVDELYLSGHVEIRYEGQKETEILRCEEAYVDIKRSVAIAIQADLEIREPKLKDPIHMKANEIFQLGPSMFEANNVMVYSTVLPSDPGFRVELRKATIEERQQHRYTIFGLPYASVPGSAKFERDRYFRGESALVRLEGVPIFYFPWIAGRVEDPLGPLDNISVSANRIFGFQLYTTFDIFDLIGVDRPPGQKWRLFADYLSARGFALGSEYNFSGKGTFGPESQFDGLIKGWGLRDSRQFDELGASRGKQVLLDDGSVVPVTHPDWRGRFLARSNFQNLPNDFTVQGQISLLSDQNFLEQFYYPEFINDYNQETFLYVKQQRGIWAWSVLGEARIRDWVTETSWLPKVDGYVLGAKPFDYFTWNLHASAGYGRLRVSEAPPPSKSVTDRDVDTGRFDFWNELSLPFQAGAFKIVPYLVGDAAIYTEDLKGETNGRLYGAAGIRGTLPLSRYYPTVQSDLFNLNGLFHKIDLRANYYFADSDTALSELPQLDRINDDVTDLAIRSIRPFQKYLNPRHGTFLATSPLFDPQLYALRRLVDNRVDTLDTIDVLQLGVRQRWQTQRGFPGREHVIDWMTLDLNASIFPHSRRDNFGNRFGILEYDWTWNVGDMTAITSQGWMEPERNGPRVFDIGTLLNRSDNTSLYIGYRHIDPLESRAVVGSVTYSFSTKYAMTASTVWDFGTDTKAYNFALTRIGTDLRMSLGVSYNSNLEAFGFTFEIVPNLIAGAVTRPASGVPFGDSKLMGTTATSSLGR